MREERHAFGLTTLIGAALLLVFAAGEASAARGYPMSGTWQDRRGQVFIPLQFPLSVVRPPFTPPHLPDSRDIHTNLAGIGFPGGFNVGMGTVLATGSSPATLTVPMNLFAQTFTGTVALKGVTLVQIGTMFTVSAPVATGMLKAGYGMSDIAQDGKGGGFTYCPGAPACTDMVGGMLSTDPPGPGGAGRVIYKNGGNKYGGVMQRLLFGGGINSFLFKAIPTPPPGKTGRTQQVGHVYFGGGTPIPQALGGAYATMNMVFLAPGVVSWPLIPPTPNGLIYFPGGKLTVAGMTTLTCGGGCGATYMLGAGQSTTNTGFPQTTGTVQVQQTTGTGGGDIFTVMGYDKRTGLGAGAIALVAGGLSQRNTLAGSTRYAGYTRLFMTMGPKVPSMSPAGFAAAGALMLLAVGYALRRRIS